MVQEGQVFWKSWCELRKTVSKLAETFVLEIPPQKFPLEQCYSEQISMPLSFPSQLSCRILPSMPLSSTSPAFCTFHILLPKQKGCLSCLTEVLRDLSSQVTVGTVKSHLTTSCHEVLLAPICLSLEGFCCVCCQLKWSVCVREITTLNLALD